MSIVTAHDVIHANIARAPSGQLCGYTTGSGMVEWSAADWKAHPGAVRICQDAGATDVTADVLDVERYAATIGDVARWVERALASYKARTRPGQRTPVIYTSMVNVTPVANALLAAGLYNGSAGLWLADWNLTDPQAIADVQKAAGPMPIHGVQWSSGQYYDTDVFSAAWLAAVS